MTELFEHFRGTGRTTKLAFAYITIAMSNPGRVYKPKDHWPTPEANIQLTAIIQSFIELCRLDSWWQFTPDSICFLDRPEGQKL